MTPKEKAIELYEKFIFPCWECDEFDRAKQCALISVNEILFMLIGDNLVIGYWQEVKQEIEKL